jgi:hypothetical protein
MNDIQQLSNRLLKIEKALGLVSFEEIQRSEDAAVTQAAKTIHDWLVYASSEINKAEKLVLLRLKQNQSIL